MRSFSLPEIAFLGRLVMPKVLDRDLLAPIYPLVNYLYEDLEEDHSWIRFSDGDYDDRRFQCPEAEFYHDPAN